MSKSTLQLNPNGYSCINCTFFANIASIPVSVPKHSKTYYILRKRSLQIIFNMFKIKPANMVENRPTSPISKNILKLPSYLLIICGHTLSTDGATVSRFMIIYSGAIYILNLILILKNVACIDNEDSILSSDDMENIASVVFQIPLQILVSVTLYASRRKFPILLRN